MCGIYGIASLETGETPAPRTLLAQMGAAIKHRGPDDEGCYLGQGIAMGMRRLSIIDLTGGHQPIPNEDESIWAICNGEIYNFKALRRELENAGHVFHCDSDTEILVHLYEQEGLDFLKKLRGMFGLALWDANRKRLVLARDRVGEKPLYLYKDTERLIFASEVKAILECEGIPRAVNTRALHDYCALGYVPAPSTLFEGIEKLLPGEVLVLEQGAITIKPYWDLSFDKVEERPEEEWVELLRDKLLESVRMQLVSDVPLGAFLSGGIDSSTIVAAMAQNSDRPVNTYSIGFEGPDQFYNELPFARAVAKQYATNHHEIVVRPDVCKLLPQLIWHMDEPVADSALITTYLIARLAGESVTVILSGVGGDELFGGYRRYLGESIGAYYRRLPGFLRRRAIPFLFARLPQDRHSTLANYARLANSYIRSAELEQDQAYADFITVFSPAIRAELLRGLDAPANSAVESYFARCRNAESLHRNMYVDIKTSLADDLLLLTDKMTMAASIECRAPLLDYELIELTARMPARMKVNGLTLKYLFKKAAAKWLPPEILNRKKRGFGAPVGAWFRDQLQPLIQDCLSREQISKRGFFDPATVERIVASHHSRSADHTDHVLALIIFELWCRIFLDQTGGSAAPSWTGESVTLG
jgi:asparagine synthase (glutamine-hydrolysing)